VRVLPLANYGAAPKLRRGDEAVDALKQGELAPSLLPAALFAPRQECEAFEQHHVGFVFQQRAGIGGMSFEGSRCFSVSGSMSSVSRSFSQSISSLVLGFFFRPGTLRMS
jgi:hypothetical protein